MNHTPGDAEPQLGKLENAELGLGAPRAGGSTYRQYKRRGLPHYDVEHAYQFVTFRLADSLPHDVSRTLEQELAALPVGRRDGQRRQRIERWQDAGRGSCALQRPAMAHVMQATLRRFDGERYHLIAWCIMPNHVHVLMETLAPLAGIVQAWKSFTGRWALAHWAELGLGLPRGGASKPRAFWMRDYWDRCIRSERHLEAAVAYIHGNPVQAGLCGCPDERPWSSATRDGAVR